MHRWTFYTFRNDVYHMYTWSIIAIPILWCHEIWQWRSQNPGLSAKKRIKVNPASGTITVSFKGGFLRFRSIFPALFRSMTFCLVIRLPEIHQGKNFDSWFDALRVRNNIYINIKVSAYPCSFLHQGVLVSHYYYLYRVVPWQEHKMSIHVGAWDG